VSTSNNSPEDFFEREKTDSRKRERRNAGYLSALFLALIVLFALIRSSQIVLVLLLYASIILEAIALSVFIALSESSWDIWDLLSRREQQKARSGATFLGGSDAVNSLHIYVKYGSRGSDYSRMEVAFVLRSIFQNSPELEKRDSQFESDLKIIYYPYIRDSSRIQPELRTRKVSRAEREAYLASLQRVIEKIREDPVFRRNY